MFETKEALPRQFSLAAVFEAVVNAVAHRDYSVSGSKIRLHLFSDRIEIYSPGALPNSLTLDEISERQFARNELICSVISRCKLTEAIQNVTRQTLMDRRGEGVPIIFEDSEKLSGRRPVYSLIDDCELKLSIPSAPGDSPEELSRIALKLTEQTEDVTVRIKEMMRSCPTVTQQQMAGTFNISRSLVAMTIAKLKAAGDIGREGSDRRGSWIVYR